jgi:mediator of RNA polymerase II transcription subunit 17
VNEDVLRTKIAEVDKGDLDEDEDGQDASELDSTERLEQLYKRRKDIIDFAT